MSGGDIPTTTMMMHAPKIAHGDMTATTSSTMTSTPSLDGPNGSSNGSFGSLYQGHSSNIPRPQTSAHRPSSSTSSFSSASVRTAKRASSVSSRSQRQSASGAGGDASLIALRVGRESGSASGEQYHHRRRRSVAVDSSERARMNGGEAGLDNLNRWSQSTTSSAQTRRSRASSGAVLPALLQKGFSSPKKSSNRSDYAYTKEASNSENGTQRTSLPQPTSPIQFSNNNVNPYVVDTTNRSSSGSETRRKVVPSAIDAPPLTALPPLHTTPSLTDPNDAETPSTLATIATPSTAQMSSAQEYFHAGSTSPSRNAISKGKQPVTARTSTGPVAAINSSKMQYGDAGQQQQNLERKRETAPNVTSQEPSYKKHKHNRSTSSTGSSANTKSKEHKRELLAKALEKANTAVLLDNAQDFDAALQAYTDACELLRFVMRLSEGETDKRKLESIRVTYDTRVAELKQMKLARPQVQMGPQNGEKSLPGAAFTSDNNEDHAIEGEGDSALLSDVLSAGAQVVAGDGKPANQGKDAPEESRGAERPFSSSNTAVAGVSRAELPNAQTTSYATAAHPEQSSADPRSTRDASTTGLSSGIGIGDGRGRAAGAATATAAVSPPGPLSTASVLHFPPPEDDEIFIPRPLSPRRPSVPDLRAADESVSTNSTRSSQTSTFGGLGASVSATREPLRIRQPAHLQDGSNLSMSWLDTIDEFGGVSGQTGSSRSSSIHSRSPERGIHRRPIPDAHAGELASDFDAAFDAAVEAAYDDGFEPDLDVIGSGLGTEVEPAVNRRHHAQKESTDVRSSMIQEIWSPPSTSSASRSTQPLPQTRSFAQPSGLNEEDDMDDDEEERMLDEITNDFAQTFNFDLTTKSALPRQSDSSGYSRSTWQSSLTSDRATAATSLSTVAEDTLPLSHSARSTRISNPASPPTGTEAQPATLAPPPPHYPLSRPSSATSTASSNVRTRRLSGNAKQLKIETSSKSEARNRASTYHLGGSPFREEDEQKAAALDLAMKSDDALGAGTAPLERTRTSDSEHETNATLKSPPSLSLLTSISDESRPMTARTTTTTTTETYRSIDGNDPDSELLTTRPSLFRKNKSSLSLREHTVLLSPTTDSLPPIVPTPMSSTFMQYGLKRHGDPGPLTSQRANFPSLTSARSASGSSHAYTASGIRVPLFDTSLSAFLTSTNNSANANNPVSSASLAVSSPRSPPAGTASLPLGLEPCPGPVLLRPFWLMRSILSTLTHPRGGFITTRLFVPREAWATPGVKLRAVEDKIANCDLLTAALGRLSGVDTYDADAIMEELQSFEDVMERVQAALTKKLGGGEVGLNGLNGLFKDAAANAAANASVAGGAGVTGAGSGGAGATVSDAASVADGKSVKSKEGKSGYLASWRKLRSKSSGTPLSAGGDGGISATSSGGAALPFLPGNRAGGGSGAHGDASLTMPTVPMTTFVPVERRGQRKAGAVDVRNLSYEGGYKEYMASLARLFDGVQVLDLIARQVEDPGLKGTSPTHVGLELSIRHAAEFFAFYVCRFVLSDLGTLLDKYIKRGSEWVQT